MFSLRNVNVFPLKQLFPFVFILSSVDIFGEIDFEVVNILVSYVQEYVSF